MTRLALTCDFLSLPAPALSEGQLATLIPFHAEGRLRVTVTPDGTFWSYAPLAPVAESPVTLWLSSIQVHPQLAQHKTGNYLPYTLAAREAARHGAFEGLLMDADACVVDGSRTSLLVQLNGELVVPRGGLPGVTREMLLREWNRPYRVERLTLSMMQRVERAWLTGSGVGVLPVERVRWPGGEQVLDVEWPPELHPAMKPPRKNAE